VRLAAAAALALVLAAGAAGAQQTLPDYDPYSDEWNGLSSFKGLVEGAGFNVDIRAQLEWSDLTANDILFIFYPLAKVDPSKLSSFIQAGGNAVVADDFGDSKEALAALGLLRAEVVAPRATSTRSSPITPPRSKRSRARPR
jgi:hypothetical protein